MNKQRRQRRNFTSDFKIQAVKLVVEQGLSRSKVAEDLGVSAAQIGKWVIDYQARGDLAFPGNGRLSPQDQQIRDLEVENRQLKMERDLLKKATAFFANQGR